jgi:hypothetical protein
VGQRVRQAYDDLAQPPRLLVEASGVPIVAVLLWRSIVRRPRDVGAAATLLALALASIGLAELGRRRAGGRSVFEPSAAFWAPAWLSERAVCVWLALAHRMVGGMPYAGQRLPTAAHSLRWLRRRRAVVLR